MYADITKQRGGGLPSGSFRGNVIRMDWHELAPDHQGRLRIAVVGAGADTTLIPGVLTAALKEMGLPSQVVSLEAEPEEFDGCINRLRDCGFKGVSVGNPHKPMAAKLASEFFLVKHSLGVANALTLGSRITAQNTEVPAFQHLIADYDPSTALVMGSGRAARSVVMGLFEAGWRVRLWNRNALRSRPFLTLFQRYGKIEMATQADPTGCAMIVNATPLGAAAGEQPPVKWTHARPHSLAVDLVFRGVATEFLRAAMQRGFKTMDGRELVVEQAALALEWWTGKKAPREPMRGAAGLVRA